MFIFLDESGNFTKHNHEEYFVIESFTVGDQRRTAKAFQAWRERFPKRMRSQAEIKWSQSGITDDLRLRRLKPIAKLDVRIRYRMPTCRLWIGFLEPLPVFWKSLLSVKNVIKFSRIIFLILGRSFSRDKQKKPVEQTFSGRSSVSFGEDLQLRLSLLGDTSETLREHWSTK